MFGPHDFPADRTLAFHFRPEGREVLARHVLAHNADWKFLLKREQRILATAITLLVLMLPLLVWQAAKFVGFPRPVSAGSISLCMGIITSVQFYLQFERATAWIRALKKPELVQKVMRTNLVLEPEGIWFGQPRSAMLIEWSRIDRVVIVDDGVGVFGHTPREGLFIAGEAFSHAGTREAFVSEAESLHRASGSMGADLVVKRLAKEHVLCDRCGQDLHGIPAPRCPECGRELTTASLQYLEMARRSWTRELVRRLRISLLGS